MNGTQNLRDLQIPGVKLTLSLPFNFFSIIYLNKVSAYIIIIKLLCIRKRRVKHTWHLKFETWGFAELSIKHLLPASCRRLAKFRAQSAKSNRRAHDVTASHHSTSHTAELKNNRKTLNVSHFMFIFIYLLTTKYLFLWYSFFKWRVVFKHVAWMRRKDDYSK